jgi:hypothetical protein
MALGTACFGADVQQEVLDVQHGTRQPGRLANAIRRSTDVSSVGGHRWSSPPPRPATTAVSMVAVLAFLLTSCGNAGPAASTSPRPSGSVQSPGPSPSRTAETLSSLTPAQTALPTASPTPVPPSWTHLEWSDPVVPFPYQPPVHVGEFGTTITINDVTEWNGGYVAVGSIDRDGACAEAGFFRSADGLHWDLTFRVVSGEDRTPTMCPQFVAKVGEELVALGQERVWSSQDGIAWAELDSASLRSLWGPSRAEELVTMAAGPGGMVMIGQPINTFDSIVAFSTNGHEWTPITLPARDTAIAWDATAGHDGFVVVGRDGQPDESYQNIRAGVGSPVAWFSADGLVWTEVEVTGTAVKGGVLTRVFPMAAGLFAIGNDVGVTSIYEEIDAVGAWVSGDGRSWDKVGTLESLVPQAAMLGSDRTNLVALRDDTAMWISTDGQGWWPMSSTGDLQVPDYLLGPLRVQPSTPLHGYDTRMWVTDHGLIFGSTTESGGFAVIQLQLGTRVAP